MRYQNTLKRIIIITFSCVICGAATIVSTNEAMAIILSGPERIYSLGGSALVWFIVIIIITRIISSHPNKKDRDNLEINWSGIIGIATIPIFVAFSSASVFIHIISGADERDMVMVVATFFTSTAAAFWIDIQWPKLFVSPGDKATWYLGMVFGPAGAAYLIP